MEYDLIHREIKYNFFDTFRHQAKSLSGDGLIFLNLLDEAAKENFWENECFKAYLRRCDISSDPFGKVCDAHGAIGDEKSLQCITDIFYSLILLNLAKFLSKPVEIGEVLKVFNVFCKLKLKISSTFFEKIELLDSNVKKSAITFINSHAGKKFSVSNNNCFKTKDRQEVNGVMRELPITYLHFEGPISRAYLETLRANNLRPKTIINLISKKNLATGQLRKDFLPKKITQTYAAIMHRNQMFFWYKKFLKTDKNLVKDTLRNVKESLMLDVDYYYNTDRFVSLRNYSHNIVDVLFSSLKDDVLFDELQKTDDKIILFTGGGIVPSKLLNVSGKKFLHVHPGFLPDVRGADCFLWSNLIYNQPSASSFFLDPGIDTGEIIAAKWLPKIIVPNSFSYLDDKMAYRFIYCFIDPWVRSKVLYDTLLETKLLRELTTIPQKHNKGTTFHFMANELKTLAFDKLNSNADSTCQRNV